MSAAITIRISVSRNTKELAQVWMVNIIQLNLAQGLKSSRFTNGCFPCSAPIAAHEVPCQVRVSTGPKWDPELSAAGGD